MSDPCKETKERLNYTEKFINAGGTVAELLKDANFQNLVEKERRNLR